MLDLPFYATLKPHQQADALLSEIGRIVAPLAELPDKIIV
jgi:hypothetical protein